MKIVGVDLAGKEKNPTGLCVMDEKMKLMTVYMNQEIIKLVENSDIVAIDAPIMKGEPRMRNADRKLKKYGAMSPKMKSMKSLTRRGSDLAEKLGKMEIEIIEVFPTATAKILKVYDKNWKKMAEKLGIPARNEHEVDAYLAARTAKHHLKGETELIGNEEGVVIIPKIIS